MNTVKTSDGLIFCLQHQPRGVTKPFIPTPLPYPAIKQKQNCKKEPLAKGMMSFLSGRDGFAPLSPPAIMEPAIEDEILERGQQHSRAAQELPAMDMHPGLCPAGMLSFLSGRNGFAPLAPAERPMQECKNRPCQNSTSNVDGVCSPCDMKLNYG